MKVKCIKTDFGTPPYKDITKGKIYEVYEVKDIKFDERYLIKDASRKRKWYSQSLFEEVKDV